MLYVARVAPGAAITSVRIRCGVGYTAAISTWLGNDTLSSIKYAAFRFSTNAGDTDWMCETGNGTSVNVASSGVAVVASTMYTLQIKFNDSVPNVVFTINGAVVYTSTTDLPGTSGCAFAHLEGLATLTAATRALNVAWIYEESDN